MYRTKMKKFFDHNENHIIDNPIYLFTNRLKLRIICDHKRFILEKFKELWDPNDSHTLFNYDEEKIITWNI